MNQQEAIRAISARSPAQDAARNIAQGYFGLVGIAYQAGYDFPGLECTTPRMAKYADSPPTYVERIFPKLYWELDVWSDIVDQNGRSYGQDYDDALAAYARVYNLEIVKSPNFPFPSVCHIDDGSPPAH